MSTIAKSAEKDRNPICLLTKRFFYAECIIGSIVPAYAKY